MVQDDIIGRSDNNRTMVGDVIMGLWIYNVIGRWKAQRIRSEKIRELYRAYNRNKAILENGGRLLDQPPTKKGRKG